jgi:hypothetical protein
MVHSVSCFVFNFAIHVLDTNKEVALMKKMNHPNLVRLFEVIDDPKKDKLYMGLNLFVVYVVSSVLLSPSPVFQTRPLSP